jgi:ABC-type glycerol-3-phosphate transport system substrate-binding protein
MWGRTDSLNPWTYPQVVEGVKQVMGAGASLTVLAACAPALGAPAAAPAAGESGAAPAQEGSGPLNVIYSADTNDSFQSVIDQFQAETGNPVNYEVAPADYLEWQQLMTTRFASGDKGTDASHCDDFQAAIYGFPLQSLPSDHPVPTDDRLGDKGR